MKPISKLRSKNEVALDNASTHIPQVGSISRGTERASIRQLLVEATVASLIEKGLVKTTRREVRKRARLCQDVLHAHFPNRCDLLVAAAQELARRNEQAAQEVLEELTCIKDGVERAVRSLATMMVQPSFTALLELTIAARTDQTLCASLAAVDEYARERSDLCIHAMFSPLNHHRYYSEIVMMTVEFLRGLALSGVLRECPIQRQQLIAHWVRTVKTLLEHWK